MGEVFLAEHPRLPRQDALKVLAQGFTADRGYRARFHREADLASTLWHPHIVGVHDRGESDGQLWIAMDFVDGIDAAELLARRYPSGMPLDLVVNIVSAVAAALDYAHRKGLLHRDVKPANIMLTHLEDDHGEQRIVLADFGIARDLGEVGGITTTNMTVGTVAYASPEQLMGEDLDGRSDQYALAATAYHLLIGSTLFPHSAPAVVISRHLNGEPPPLSATRPDLKMLDGVLAAALNKNPGDRYERCQDFARALAEPVGAAVPAAVAPTKPAVAVAPRHLPTQSAPAAQNPPVHSTRQASTSSPKSRRLTRIAVSGLVVATAAIALTISKPWQQNRPTDPPASTSQALNPTLIKSPVLAPPPPPPPPATFPAASIDSLLLSPQEINDELGTYATYTNSAAPIPMMSLEDSSYGMSDHAALVTPQECAGVVFGAEHRVYADTGFTEMRDQTFRPETYVSDETITPPWIVEQTVTVYPTAEAAQALTMASQKEWESCAASTVTEDVPPEDVREFSLGTVQRNGDMLTVSMASNNHNGAQACQHALGVRENVVVGTRSCNDVAESSATEFTGSGWPVNTNWASDEAGRLAQVMLGKVRT
jgi:serine/threonine protein kinase